jgi:hypothetical protein
MSKNRSKRSKRAALHERSKHASYCKHYIRIHKTKYVEAKQFFSIFIRRVNGNMCMYMLHVTESVFLPVY